MSTVNIDGRSSGIGQNQIGGEVGSNVVVTETSEDISCDWQDKKRLGPRILI